MITRTKFYKEISHRKTQYCDMLMKLFKKKSIVTWCIVTGEGGGRGQGNKERKERREKFRVTFVDEVVE